METGGGLSVCYNSLDSAKLIHAKRESCVCLDNLHIGSAQFADVHSPVCRYVEPLSQECRGIL